MVSIIMKLKKSGTTRTFTRVLLVSAELCNQTRRILVREEKQDLQPVGSLSNNVEMTVKRGQRACDETKFNKQPGHHWRVFRPQVVQPTPRLKPYRTYLGVKVGASFRLIFTILSKKSLCCLTFVRKVSSHCVFIVAEILNIY